jgi:hypothetical protein
MLCEGQGVLLHSRHRQIRMAVGISVPWRLSVGNHTFPAQGVIHR